MAGTGADYILVATSIALPVVIIYGMFFAEMGGGMPVNTVFPWHPVLMCISFPCLMQLGRLAYTGAWDLTKPARRQMHRALMMAAVASMLVGYYFIFAAHLPGRKFFGYDFVNHVWADPRRVAHSFLGYALILAVFLQGAAGAQKMTKLQDTDGKEKIHTWHGSLGKIILVLGLLEILLATWFWGWSAKLKAVIVMLSLVLGGSSLRPTPAIPEQSSLMPYDSQ